MSEELKCIITITGKSDSNDASIKFDFNPLLKTKDGNNPWDNNGAGQMAAIVLDAIQQAARENS